MTATEALIHCLSLPHTHEVGELVSTTVWDAHDTPHWVTWGYDYDTDKAKGSPSLCSEGPEAFDTKYEPYRTTKEPTVLLALAQLRPDGVWDGD